MNTDRTGVSYDDDAAEYDRQARDQGWYIHEALFGLMHEFINPGETLLDIGIGTGLGSFMFHKMGLRVSGFDNSRDMLRVCESKGFATALTQHDLRDTPFPYPATSFNHVIAIGVLNFYADLAPVFMEAARIIRPQGIFCFTVEDQKPGEQAEYVFRTSESAGQPNDEKAVTMYRHSEAHINGLLAGNSFAPLKRLEFFADRHLTQGPSIYFKGYVARQGTARLPSEGKVDTE